MATGRYTSGKIVFLRSGRSARAPFAGRALAALLVLLLAFAGAAPAMANSKYASIVMDAGTGEILSQSHADKSLHPASLTKVMTLLLAFDALQQGRIGLNDRIRMSSHAAGMPPSKLGLQAGESLRVKDAIGALVTKSANDVAAALAEHIAGTESGFARQMTRRARDIGMERTTFVNASGLHDPRQVSTARDMAVMARYVIRNYPEYYRYFSMSSFTYQGRTYRNHNRLMESYKGMDGMKTGYIAASGFNLVASAVRGDQRLIGVVFGGKTTASRNEHMASLLDRGFEKNGKEDLLIARAGMAGAGQGAAQGNNAPHRVSVPVPERKPPLDTALAAAAPGTLKPRDMAPAGAHSPDSYTLALADLETPSGEGDADPGLSRRIETGLLAIAAHRPAPETAPDNSYKVAMAQKTEYRFNPSPGVEPAAYSPGLTAPVAPADGAWSVQVGAFASRAATDQTLHEALNKLPGSYSRVQPVIAPLKTADGWLFRARLTGFTHSEALAACNYLRDCLPVAPQN